MHFTRRSLALLLLCVMSMPALGLLVSAQEAPKPAPAPAPAAPSAEEKQAAQAEKNLRCLDECISAIKEKFYNKPGYNGVNLAEWREEWKDRVGAAPNTTELHKVIREALKSFKASHFTIMRGDTYLRNFAPEMNNTTTAQFGMDLTAADGRIFVDDACASGAARAAGIKRGDEIVTLNGVPVFESLYLTDGGSDPLYETHYCIVPPIKGDLTFGIRREAGGPVEEVLVKAAQFSMINATRESVQVIERDGRKYGYLRIYHFLHSEIANIAADAIARFKDCDGVMVDLRGRGGSAPLLEEVLSMVGGKGASGGGDMMRRGARGGGRARSEKYNGPVVCLIDSSSRSAKEIFAHNFRIDTGNKLIGQPTAGAVIAGSFTGLSDGSYLLIPVSHAEVFARDKAVLEGNPVKPDIEVDIKLQYCNGHEHLIEAGLKQLAIEAAAREAKAGKDAAGKGAEKPEAPAETK